MPSNILLGDDMRAKVADFGLVMIAPDGKGEKFSIETKVAATFSYLAREYAVRIADPGPLFKLKTYEDKGSLGQALQIGRAQYIPMDLRDQSQVGKRNVPWKPFLWNQ